MSIASTFRRHSLPIALVVYIAFLMAEGVTMQLYGSYYLLGNAIFALAVLVVVQVVGHRRAGNMSHEDEDALDEQWLQEGISKETIIVIVVFFAITVIIKLMGVEEDPFARIMNTPDEGTPAARLALTLVMCVLTAVQEEGLLCGILFPLLSHGAPRARWQCAFLFGIAHLFCGYLLPFALMKMAQAVLFGYCMTVLCSRTRSIAVPVAVHALFDAIYFAIL